MIIKVDKVNKSFKKVQVLFDVDMNLESGKIYGLVGRNGSGKSVFLKILCGFYHMDSGTIYLNDKNIFEEYDYLPNARCLIEKSNFLPNMTGIQNLRLLASIQNKISDDEIFEALSDVNLLEEKDKLYSKYSLGMKQKLGIAQTLMENPDIIILDEPFNGIDKDSITKIRNVLLKKKEEGKLILIATHNNDDINYLADVVYCFENGRVEERSVN